MKRSEINALVEDASRCFEQHGWALPPNPKWDVTDFGLGNWRNYGLVLVNLAEQPEYCEKLMYAWRGMATPAHTHLRKKEDIICRWGMLAVQLWNDEPGLTDARPFYVLVNGDWREVISGEVMELNAGERVTLTPGIYHEFYPVSDECIIGEVSTANDDVNDNVFFNPEVGRFPEVVEDVPASVDLVSDP
jgi:D-lyxose ketol-isomerase